MTRRPGRRVSFTPQARLDRADARADARLSARAWFIARQAVDGVWTCPVCGTPLPVAEALDHRCPRPGGAQ